MKNKPREFHIWDFPDNIYVLIEDKVRYEFFKIMYKKFGSQKDYAKFLNTERNSIQGYHYARSWHKGERYIKFTPLKLLKKSLKFINKKLKNKIEKNVTVIRIRGGKNITNLKLSIKESPELYSIIGHMIADGCQSTHHVPYYANSNGVLREKFIEKLSIFGEDFKISEKKTKTTTIVEFPKVITDIIQHLFNFQITHPNRIPKLLFSSSNGMKCSFIAALFDDDGSISHQAVLTIHNLNLIEQVKRLMTNLNIKTNKISIFQCKHKKDKISLSVSSKSIRKFYNLIPIEHPAKKLNLEYKIKIKNRNKYARTRNPILIEEKILELLEFKPSRTIEIANQLLFTLNGVLPHLNKLNKERMIIRRGYKNKIIWDLA